MSTAPVLRIARRSLGGLAVEVDWRPVVSCQDQKLERQLTWLGSAAGFDVVGNMNARRAIAFEFLVNSLPGL